MTCLASTTIENFHCVDATSGIYRGGQPRTAEEWDFIKSLPVTQVIKLNEDSEGDDSAWTGELFKVEIPWTEQIITEPDFNYLVDAVGFIGGLTYVHCQHGQDRTGLIMALWRLTQGWTVEAAEKEWKALGGDKWCLPGLLKAWQDYAPKFVEDMKPW